ncbi:1-aminocyclopropane-1-carboxylate deaminase/D-cysteine desulfhydrase [Rhodococcus sp. W8901]|uniref:1-aminocyclopropane-1-carboxylate deaminase/D-cysteine desulfhydrase n=1 Tax=Rhodococcus sp. W8901 TaxID=2742603 RepID=UPI001583630A|nr:pyridoxal-phosphate dependent enzyme [Rhodococcus sp. W8901]QKT10147.1 pyridoxal-phosphate dependent enzyme [Rhodococcus sp. W8901]
MPDVTTAPLLHQRFPELAESLPHVPLGVPPTPVRRLDGLGTRNRIWVKDDSTFGSGGWGGNKVRKLEWIIPDVLARKSRRIITVGGLGTNWGLATALYAREFGIETAIALIDQPVDDHVRAQLARLQRSGATLHFTRNKVRTFASAPWLMLRHIRGGRLPYYLPPGGSSPIGALGYVEAALELAAQVEAGDIPEPAHIVAPVGSGGTVAGLLLGLQLAGLRTGVVAVVVNDTLPLGAAEIRDLAGRAESLLRRRGAQLGEIDLRSAGLTVTREYLGPGYGYATAEGRAAQRVGTEYRVPLDPVYTAKAFAGLLEIDAKTRVDDGPIVMLDTFGPRPD